MVGAINIHLPVIYEDAFRCLEAIAIQKKLIDFWIRFYQLLFPTHYNSFKHAKETGMDFLYYRECLMRPVGKTVYLSSG